MAEPTGSSGTGPTPAPPITDRPISVPGTPAAPLAYKPLSLPALVSLVLAILYTVFVLISGFIGFRQSKPLVMPSWLLLLPLASLVLAFIGWWQIRNSEGTRAGEKLAVRGGLLSLLMLCSYLAYLGATYLASQRQAEQFAMRWFEDVKKGNMYQAFYYSLDPARRQGDNPENKSQMDLRYLANEGRDPGPLARFRKNPLVRLVQLAGDKAEIVPGEVLEWNFTDAGFKVTQDYHVTTEEGTFDAIVTCGGRESPLREFEGRQWYVMMETTNLRADPDRVKLTELGKQRNAYRIQAARFVGSWIGKLAPDQMHEAFLDTLEPAKRKALKDTDQDKIKALPEYQAFLKGGLVDQSHFKAQEPVRTQIYNSVRDGFSSPDGNLRYRMSLDNMNSMNIPRVTEEDGKVQVRYELQVGVTMELAAEAEVVLEKSASDPDERAWRVAALELTDGRRVLVAAGPPGLE